MKHSIFEYSEYRAFLLMAFGDKSQRRGLKTEAAKFMGCHSTLLSQILHGKTQLGVEQAERLNRFLNHSEDEAHYFLLLVLKDRSGTRELREYFQKQMNRILDERLIIKKRIGKTDSVSREHEHQYYSSWLYSAVHVALSVPSLRNVPALTKQFRISQQQVKSILAFLMDAGLAKMKGDEYIIGPTHIHLGTNSMQISNHHRNWRIRALESLDVGSGDDLHYSAAVTLSRADISTIKDQLIKSVQNLSKSIQESKEEEIFGLNIDFFKA